MLSTPTLRPIQELARDLQIDPDHVVPYGTDKAKIRLAARHRGPRRGKLILVTAITPTSAGEGKTTTAIGLAQGLAAEGERVSIALREPSLGPTFGLKGGATGGGRASLVPAEDINLHFTGDFHAISTANNLLAAALDNSLHHGNRLQIDPRRVLWRRVMDLNDRSLRQILIGLGGPSQGVPRESGFDITPASEVMAVLCLARDEDDLRRRLGRLIVAQTHDKKPVTAEDLQATGAMMVILKDALLPNLVQTCEGVPAFVHGGPFANIAHGCNSVVATEMALAHSDVVVTEAGFGADLGAEKFFDIKCRSAGLDPAAVVLVATARALKRHGGVVHKKLDAPDPEAVERGLANLHKHVENIQAFGRTPIVAVNRFPSDSDQEIAIIQDRCAELGVRCAVSEGVTRGGDGTRTLARAVLEHLETEPAPFEPLYALEETPQAKLEKIAQRMYGAGKITYAAAARQDLKRISRLGCSELPLCVAKTPMSLSANPRLVGRPSGFGITVQRVLLAAGAGFLIPMLGDVMRMPGLPKVPQMKDIDLVDGVVKNLR